jgi:CP family cyanate transporter-like MFS transporter
VAITVGNIALPVVIGEDFPTAVGLLTALYTAALNIGSTVTSSLTPLLERAWGWRVALAAWAVLGVAAAATWRAASRRRPPAAAGEVPGAGAPRGASVWRRPGTWGLTAAFAGQAFGYYGATAWLPTLLVDERGMGLARAGASSSLFQVMAVAGAFCVPLLLRTTARPRLVLWLVCAAWLALPVGLLLAPQAWWLWCAAAGAAQGGGITVVFVAVVARSADADESRRLSAAVQGAGYTLAALGPTAVGAVHDASHGWQWPLVVIAGAIAVMLLAGSLVLPARERRTARVVPEEV